MKITKTIEKEYTWEQVEEILAAGKAKEEFGLGGELTVKVEGIGDVVMQAIDFDRERVVIPGTRHNMTLQFRDLILPERPFDINGKNIWRTSSLRAELNDLEFINRFEEGFRKLLVPVLKDNSDGLNTEDTFFLLSKDELKDEKKRYAFFETEKDCVKINRKKDTAWYWTRSAYRGSAYFTWYVNTSGYVGNSSASTAFRPSPACVLSV